MSALLLACGVANGDSVPTKKPRPAMGHTVVDPAYKREALPNGQWETETYAIGLGKVFDPTGSDDSLTALSTDELVSILAEALYKENYLPESDPEKTELMIVVSWGKTIPYHDGLQQFSLDGLADAMNGMNQANMELGMDNSGLGSGGNVTTGSNQFETELETMLTIQSMADRARRQANEYNAQLLGFAPDMADLYSSDLVGGPQRMLLDELEAEIETERYFVILQAYDFADLVEKKEKRLRWITRFSIRAKGRQFDEELPNMANAASALFGVKSNKIKRRLLPGGTNLGELELVEALEDEEVDKD